MPIRLDYSDFEDVLKEAANPEKAINDVLHGEGGELLVDEIIKLLPESGRCWKGKKAAAKSTMPFLRANTNLSVTVKNTADYGYLYFPDDGTNTRKHAGQQFFMHHGAENATDEITKRIQEKLIEQIGGN